jgi:hypothetical protein
MAGKSSKRQRVYYAHARCTYGEPDEGHDLQRIRTELPRISIVNPAKYEGDPLKQADTMGFCFNLIEGCDMVVFTRLMGKITSGVGKEINHALGLGKPVFELSEDLLSPCTRKVAYISINDQSVRKVSAAPKESQDQGIAAANWGVTRELEANAAEVGFAGIAIRLNNLLEFEDGGESAVLFLLKRSAKTILCRSLWSACNCLEHRAPSRGPSRIVCIRRRAAQRRKCCSS